MSNTLIYNEIVHLPDSSRVHGLLSDPASSGPNDPIVIEWSVKNGSQVRSERFVKSLLQPLAGITDAMLHAGIKNLFNELRCMHQEPGHLSQLPNLRPVLRRLRTQKTSAGARPSAYH